MIDTVRVKVTRAVQKVRGTQEITEMETIPVMRTPTVVTNIPLSTRRNLAIEAIIPQE
jgi:hypothetical protein